MGRARRYRARVCTVCGTEERPPGLGRRRAGGRVVHVLRVRVLPAGPRLPPPGGRPVRLSAPPGLVRRNGLDHLRLRDRQRRRHAAGAYLAPTGPPQPPHLLRLPRQRRRGPLGRGRGPGDPHPVHGIADNGGGLPDFRYFRRCSCSVSYVGVTDTWSGASTAWEVSQWGQEQ